MANGALPGTSPPHSDSGSETRRDGMLESGEPPLFAAAVPTLSMQAAKQVLNAVHSRSLPQPSDTEWRRYRPQHQAQVGAMLTMFAVLLFGF